jgi:hypothetical protein
VAKPLGLSRETNSGLKRAGQQQEMQGQIHEVRGVGVTESPLVSWHSGVSKQSSYAADKLSDL